MPQLEAKSKKNMNPKGRPRFGIYKNCIVCKKEFYVPQCQKSAKYCSNSCRLTALKNKPGELNWNWKGGKKQKICPICKKEFKTYNNSIFCSNNCRIQSAKDNAKYKIQSKGNQKYRIVPGTSHTKEHVAIAEKVLGRKLKKGEIVHHINMNGLDNRNCNLLICTQKYHAWLHTRYAAAFAAKHLNF